MRDPSEFGGTAREVRPVEAVYEGLCRCRYRHGAVIDVARLVPKELAPSQFDEMNLGALDRSGRRLAKDGDKDGHWLVRGEAVKGRSGPSADVRGIDGGGGQRKGVVLAEILRAVLRGQQDVPPADDSREPLLADEVSDDLACGVSRSREVPARSPRARPSSPAPGRTGRPLIRRHRAREDWNPIYFSHSRANFPYRIIKAGCAVFVCMNGRGRADVSNNDIKRLPGAGERLAGPTA